MIADTVVVNDIKPMYEDEPENDTLDKVFLLSLDELEKYYGIGPDKWDDENEILIGHLSACKREWYIQRSAEEGGFTFEELEEMYRSDEELYGPGFIGWWLRSPGEYYCYAACVRYYGRVIDGGNNVDEEFNAVRPALWIDLE